MWYAVGRSCDERNGVHQCWVKVYKLEEQSFAYKYTTSLHWSLTQFTPASMEIVPQNSWERLFAVIILLVAMITFSSFVSILTAYMMELRKISSDGSRQFWMLRRYLRDWGVPRRIGSRIQRYLEYAYKRHRQRVQERDVVLLQLLSEPLREELKYETFSAHLCRHPLFCRCEHRTRCFSKSLQAFSYARGDVLFTAGQQAKAMLFVTTGMLEYTLGEQESEEVSLSCKKPSAPEVVLEEQWVCEAVLWTPWLHLGDCESMQVTQSISVEAQRFGEAIQDHRLLLMAVRNYADRFVEELNRVDRDDLTDLLHQVFNCNEVLDDCAFTFDASKSINLEDDTESRVLPEIGRRLLRMLTAE
mmetsp:Transcript_5303/g.10130  ORF Transcript_5303/g.10130 Transcript_5303/m.10130 type:complete len:359 (+) Transcript_5303:3-1079(+)